MSTEEKRMIFSLLVTLAIAIPGILYGNELAEALRSMIHQLLHG